MFQSLEYPYGVLYLLMVFVLLVVYIFFLFSLQKTLELIDISSRTMHPAQVWLALIPIFSFIWEFIMVSRISDSIRNESNRLHIPLEEPKPAYRIGLTMAILSVCGIVPGIDVIASLASAVAMIFYWKKVIWYKKLILANQDNFLFDAEREAAGIVE